MATRPDKEDKTQDAVSSETGVAAAPFSAAVSTSNARRPPAARPGLASRFAAHPLLFGCLFVLQGYAQLQPMGNTRDLFVDLGAVLCMVLVLQFAFLLLVPHPRKPGLLTSLCVLFFCFFGDFQTQMLEWTQGTHWRWLGMSNCLLPIEGTLFLALCAWTLRTPRPLVTTRRYLDALSVLLVAWTLAVIFRAPSPPVLASSPLADVPMSPGEHPPDIYYILTDAYTSPESLKAFWGYDDSPLVNHLTDLGFHVLKNARGNATFTPICLSTYLNMQYPPPPPADWRLAAREAYFCRIIRQAEAPARLKASGYDVRALSIFDVAGEPRMYSLPRISDPALANVLWDRTVFGYVYDYCIRVRTADTNLKIFSLLPQIAAERSNRPKFVYAHLLMPHWPYLFDQNGRRVLRGMGRSSDRPEDYLGQLIYENSLITNAVAGILRNSKAPPIIIVQGDHGYRALPGPHNTEEAATILNALYLPGSQADWLYPGITPVNTFRLIFNHYFGQHYGYLPDIVPSQLSPFVGVPPEK